jgi:putative tricarboxylic transport membrane protein
MAVGVMGGVITAAIPGFTITMAIILTLPLTYSMTPVQGIATLLAVWVGGGNGGLFSAALLGIPGTPSAVATTFDAYPMSRRGEPGRALSLGTWASFFGTLISTVVLIIAAPPLATIAVKLGPWEYFSLIVFSMTIVASLVGASMLRGLIAGVLGLFVATIGPDPMMGQPRFTFGWDLLAAGFPFLVVLIGLYAISQLLGEVEEVDQGARGEALIADQIDFHPIRVMMETLSRPVVLLRSSLVGVFIGAVPGAGGSIANLLAYDVEKRASKHPEAFGTGIPDGVVSSEAGNSSTAGGGLIPVIAMGIPGGAVEAVLMASLMVHGITVGPRLIIDHADIVYGMFVALVVASLMMLVFCLSTMRLMLYVTNVPKYVIISTVMVFTIIGAYTLGNRLSDVYLLLIAGALGYAMRKLDFPLAPLVLGVILGPIAETNLRRALMADADWMTFLTRPISLGLLVMAVLSILWSVRYHLRTRTRG